MERYSTLWGTEQSGPYCRLGSSKRLANFLTQKIGAANVRDVVELTEKLVTGIVTLPGYEHETLINKPLAVVYAPLYLDKKPGMARGMKGFCALAVSGLEHRDVRESSFSHTWFFPREDMLADGEYTYLDLLMGTQLTTSQDVDLHREGSLPVNLDRAPEKVKPGLSKKDLLTVLTTIDALYQKKNVVLVLEAGAKFNRRAMELLTEIYSLMQPMLATETGFATYQNQKRILDLSAETNVQIYVVPAGTDLSALPASKFLILDAANPAKPVTTPVLETLFEWAKMDWARRSKAMRHLFANNADYTNGDYFVKLSREFFAQNEDLNAWISDNSKDRTITTLAQLQAEDKTATGWKLVPWAKDAFTRKYPALMADKVEILNARNIAEFYEYNGTDEALRSRSVGKVDAAAVNSAAQQYKYGHTLAATNEAELCRLIWEKADQRVGVGYRNQLASQALQHQQAVDGMKQAHQQAIADKDSQIAAHLKAIDDQKTHFETEMKNRETDYQQKWDAREADYKTEKDTAVAAEAAKTAAVQEKLDGIAAVHAGEIEQLKQDAQGALDALREKENAKLQALNTANQTLTTNLEQAELDKESLQGSLNQANVRNQQLQGELCTAQTENGNLKQNNESLRTANEDLAGKLANIGKRVTTLTNERDQEKQKYDDLMEQYKRATGRKPDPVIHIGPFKLPQSAVPVVAVAAAVALLLGALLGFLIGGLFGGEPAAYDLQWSANNVVGSASEMGNVTLSHTTAEAGETITVKVVPAAGWQIDGVSSKSGTVVTKVSDTEYTLVMPEQDESIQVSFSELPTDPAVFEIQWSANGQTGNAGDMGSVTLSTNSAAPGDAVTVTVVPAAGWQVDAVKCQSGGTVSAVNDTEYSFIMPGFQEMVLVTFSEIPQAPDVLNEDGTINWDALSAQVDWIDTVETDPAAMEEILGKDAFKDWNQEAILLTANWDAEGAQKPYILVLGREDNAAASDKELREAALELLEKGWLVVDNGDRCLVMPAAASDAQNTSWTEAAAAALDVMDLLRKDNDRLTALAYRLEDDRIIDLQELAAAANMADSWWLELEQISFKKSDAEEFANALDTVREVSMTLKFADDTMGAVLNYQNDSAKGDEMVNLAKNKDRDASHVGDFVLVLMNGPQD